MSLAPRFTVSAELSFSSGGALSLAGLPGGVAAQLVSFFKGDKGDRGEPGEPGTPADSTALLAQAAATSVALSIALG